jgi:hypothetical protein
MIASGIFLFFIVTQVSELENILLPMHIPILLCGFLCGAPYVVIAGFIVPIITSALLGTPEMIPTAATMSVELMIYGLMSEILYKKF